MSQMHSHGPGQPMHSHGPAPPQPAQPQPGQPQKQVMPPPDPVMQAVIDASYQPVDIVLGPPDNVAALCSAHSLEKCTDCGIDFIALNRVSKLLLVNSNLRCPPPPQMVTQKLSQVINATKEEGNALFKAGHHMAAVQRYTAALNMAKQRSPWEMSVLTREELSTILSNRSAANFEGGDHLSALVDAETVIQIRRPWSKGYFRKAKALIKLEQFHDAKETIQAGLIYEPDNVEMLLLLATIDAHIKERIEAKTNEKSNGVESTPPAA